MSELKIDEWAGAQGSEKHNVYDENDNGAHAYQHRLWVHKVNPEPKGISDVLCDQNTQGCKAIEERDFIHEKGARSSKDCFYDQERILNGIGPEENPCKTHKNEANQITEKSGNNRFILWSIDIFSENIFKYQICTVQRTPQNECPIRPMP